MKKWRWVGLAALLGAGTALAEEWIPVRQDEATVRDIERASITRDGASVHFTARHTFADVKEYQVGRRGAKYLLVKSRVDCARRTLAQLATEARDENMALISSQKIHDPQDDPVSPGSIDERVLDVLCKP